MKRLMWGLIGVILGLGCKQSLPEGIMEQSKMESILFDMHVVDGYVSSIYVQDSAKKVAAAYYNGIYKKYDTDSARYNKSLTYYYQHPEDLQKIYGSITKRLDNQKKNIQKIDSLSNVKRLKADSVRIAKLKKSKKTDTIKKADSVKKAVQKPVLQEVNPIKEQTQPLKRFKKLDVPVKQ